MKDADLKICLKADVEKRSNLNILTCVVYNFNPISHRMYPQFFIEVII